MTYLLLPSVEADLVHVLALGAVVVVADDFDQVVGELVERDDQLGTEAFARHAAPAHPGTLLAQVQLQLGGRRRGRPPLLRHRHPHADATDRTKNLSLSAIDVDEEENWREIEFFLV